jgi:hypothetical protein
MSPYSQFENATPYEFEDPGFEMEGALTCDDAKLPSPSGTSKKLTRGRTQCPTRATAFNILSKVVENAVGMMDNTIAKLTQARQAVCRGEASNLDAVTACWLKYKLSVCIDNPSAWSDGTFKSRSVAEVIRRLVRPRDLLASNELTYVCEAAGGACSPTTTAWTIPLEFDPSGNPRCIGGTPDRIIHLCPLFWTAAHAPFREQTIIHELVHLTHCGREDQTVGVTIGSPECLAQFVVASNGKKLDGKFIDRCGFSKRCGPIPSGVMRKNCAG